MWKGKKLSIEKIVIHNLPREKIVFDTAYNFIHRKIR